MSVILCVEGVWDVAIRINHGQKYHQNTQKNTSSIEIHMYERTEVKKEGRGGGVKEEITYNLYILLHSINIIYSVESLALDKLF